MSEERTPAQQIDDFLRGSRDRKEGLDHKEGQSRDYDRGYACGYELEQIRTARTGG